MVLRFYIDLIFIGYGKSGVCFLKIKCSGKYYDIKQIEVVIELKLVNYQDYMIGNNVSVILMDIQKNIVYVLVKDYLVGRLLEFFNFCIYGLKLK